MNYNDNVCSRPDRDSHITFIKTAHSHLLTLEDQRLWDLGDGGNSKYQLSKLASNFDIQSIMEYPPYLGIKALNDYYNEVGFGDRFDMTATDKIALNVQYNCNHMKKKIYLDFKAEEAERYYIELMQLMIKPNNKSER